MVGFALAVAELFEECEEISCRLCHENAQSADFQGVSEISVLFGIGPRLSYPPGHTGRVNDDEKNQSDCQIIRFSNYQIGEPPLPKREGEPSFRLVIVRCSAGKNGSDRVRRIGCVWERLGRSWRGTCRVPRTILAGHRRFAGIWGVLGIFGDICSKWAWGAPPAGAEDPSSLDPRSNMNEGLRKDPSSQGPRSK